MAVNDVVASMVLTVAEGRACVDPGPVDRSRSWFSLTIRSRWPMDRVMSSLGGENRDLLSPTPCDARSGLLEVRQYSEHASVV
jgi:hypothetical protein